MTEMPVRDFLPDYASPPGDTIAEMLACRGMTQADLAERTGRSRKMINELIKGKAPLTPEMAIALELVLDVPARLWLNRESRYRETLARLQEREKLADQVGFLDMVPVSAMVRLGWLQRFPQKVDQLLEVLRFFGMASPEQWHENWQAAGAAFRMSPTFQADPGAVAAWLRQGELMAAEIQCDPYSEDRFWDVLSQVRALTPKCAEEFCRPMVDLCAATGVAVVFVPPLPKIRASGATRWLSPSKALIQLSLRYRTDDQLWFTFFHEACHILRHPRRRAFLEIERNAGPSPDKFEQEANRFAQDFLIAPETWAEFVGCDTFTDMAVRDFASAQGIAPGIVVGRLQHDGHVPYQSGLNRLKQRFAWSYEAAGAG